MNYIRITNENIDKEHICCAMSGKQSAAKKEWLRQRFDDGLVFYRSEERGKCFIEYIPAENAWVPIAAEGYLYINCLWVSGSMKGHGYSIMYLPIEPTAKPPYFKECAKHPVMEEAGFVLYYTDQCPYTCYWVPRVQEAAKEHGIPFKAIHITDKESAQKVPAPVTTYALFRDGQFLTQSIQSDKKFLALAGL